MECAKTSERDEILRGVVHPWEFNNERILKMKLKVRSLVSSVSFFVVYGPTEFTRDEDKKMRFLGSTVQDRKSCVNS